MLHFGFCWAMMASVCQGLTVSPVCLHGAAHESHLAGRGAAGTRTASTVQCCAERRLARLLDGLIRFIRDVDIGSALLDVPDQPPVDPAAYTDLGGTRMRRLASLLACVLAIACAKKETPPPAQASTGPAPGTPEWKIENARSGAPLEIGKGATVLDWPTSESAPPGQLVAGTNGWTCFPDEPSTPANDPGCLDKEAMKFLDAMMKRRAPQLSAIGMVYELQGSMSASNTDPFKTKPDSGQPWLVFPPFVVVIAPNPRSAFAGWPTTPAGGGPWVMYAGTPYAHLMVPVAPAAKP